MKMETMSENESFTARADIAHVAVKVICGREPARAFRFLLASNDIPLGSREKMVDWIIAIVGEMDQFSKQNEMSEIFEAKFIYTLVGMIVGWATLFFSSDELDQFEMFNLGRIEE